jgi:hypothetical protein
MQASPVRDSEGLPSTHIVYRTMGSGRTCSRQGAGLFNLLCKGSIVDKGRWAGTGDCDDTPRAIS